MTKVAEIRISLADITPDIWRSVLVSTAISLAGLHSVIQAAMGWENAHLHMFKINGKRYGLPEDDDGPELLDAAEYRLDDLVVEGDRFLYIYDLGDDWRHEITVVSFRPMAKGEIVPAALAGERACPPEDCGGPFAYPEMLEALADSNHEDHEHFREWAEDFDAEAFDLDLANKRLRARNTSSASGH